MEKKSTASIRLAELKIINTDYNPWKENKSNSCGNLVKTIYFYFLQIMICFRFINTKRVLKYMNDLLSSEDVAYINCFLSHQNSYII